MTKKFIRKLFLVRGVGRCSVIATCGGAVIVAALVFRAMSGGEDVAAEVAATNSAKASASRTSRSPAQARKPSPSDIVAVVSGRKITRSQLGKECLKHYSKQVFESVVNRYLIELECQKFGVKVTKAQIDEEIDRIAQRFSLPVDQWLDLLQTERNISVPHYRMEIIWPTLALRKLAAGQLRVTDNEVVKEFETRFGPQVQIRMISVKSRDEASQLQKHLGQKPADFPRVAAKHSTDINSASAGGLVQPIRKHVGEPKIQQVAFNMREGEISQILPLGDQFLILKCEKHIDPRPPAKQQMKQARELVVETIRDRKIRVAGGKLFKRLQVNAKVKNVLDDPVLSKKMPGVAGTLNGHQITISELEDACIARHGRGVLDATISKLLLEMELAKSRKTVTQPEVQAEVERAAVLAGITENGVADVRRWIKLVTEQEEITEQAYVSNVVWPTVALKKLVADEVKVTNDDLQKAFEANYGPRVRVRAIVMNNLRRAQEVWDMARRKPTPEHFGELASEYSVDPGGKALGGIVPPIHKNSGQPTIEKMAFQLKPGELSSVIQVSDKYIIMLCEGTTKPVVVEMKDVRDELYQDILEKKYRMEMAKRFEKIHAGAKMTHYLYPDMASNRGKSDGLGQNR